jgi:hypothetical protein
MEERELRENFERLEAYSDVSEEALPEGIWSTDLEIRKGEIEQYRRDIWVGPANAIVLHDWTHHPGEEPPF